MIKMKMRNFKKYQEQFEFMRRNFPDELEVFLLDLGKSALRVVRKRTPKKSGKLRDAWKISNVERKGEILYIQIYNEVFYAPFVEFGHRIMGSNKTYYIRNGYNKNGHFYSRKRVQKEVKGKVTGVYMLTTTIRRVNKQIPKRLKKMFDELVSRS